MGQKVNPHGARVGVIFNWSTQLVCRQEGFSRTTSWRTTSSAKCSRRSYYAAGISHIDIERSANRVTINIFTAKPGIDHRPRRRGHRGAQEGHRSLHWASPANINIMEIKVPDTNAQLVAENIAQQLEKRISFRRAMKQSLAARHARRRQGHQDHRVRPSGRRGYRPHRALSRGLHPPADAARRHRLRLRRSQDHLWPLWASKYGCTRDSVFPSPRKRRSPPKPKEANKLC